MSDQLTRKEVEAFRKAMGEWAWMHIKTSDICKALLFAWDALQDIEWKGWHEQCPDCGAEGPGADKEGREELPFGVHSPICKLAKALPKEE